MITFFFLFFFFSCLYNPFIQRSHLPGMLSFCLVSVILVQAVFPALQERLE